MTSTRRSSLPAQWSAADSPSAAALSAQPSVTAWQAARRSPASPATRGARPAVHDHVHHRGLVEAMYFINLVFMVLFVFVLAKK